MIPTIDQRIRIIFCWYLVLTCFFIGQHTLPAVTASSGSAEASLRLLDDSELDLLDIERQHQSRNDRTTSTAGTSSSSSSPVSQNQPLGTSFTASGGNARINNNHKINLVSYTANLDNILNSLEDDEEVDDDDRRFGLDDRRIVSGAKLYERNHEANVQHDEAAKPVHHRLLVNQIVQKYYPNHRRHRRSLLLRRSARSSDSGVALKRQEVALPFASSTLTPSSFSSSSSPLSPPSSSSVARQVTRTEPVVHDPSNQSSSNYGTSEYDKPEKNGKMAVKNIIRSNNSEHNYVRNLTLANAEHSSSDKSRASVQEGTTNGEVGSFAANAAGSALDPKRQDVLPEVEHQKEKETESASGVGGSAADTNSAPETNTSTQRAVTSTQTSSPMSASVEVAPPELESVVERTITPREEHLPQNSYSAINVDSFNLLDDSVYVRNSSNGRTMTAANHGDGSYSTPSAKQPQPEQHESLSSNNIFAGENFDEQIIFLNGGDLLEASPEQYDMRQFGKVERDVKMGDLRNGDPFLLMNDEPVALALRPIIRGPTDDHTEDNVGVVYAEQHETVTMACEVDADITSSVWLKNGQMVHVMDKKSRTDDVRFVRESLQGITISNVMLEDDGVWQCEAENARGFFFNGRPIKLVVLDPPKEPYLLIDQRRLDAGNMFIPVKENSELTLACVSEGGNPKPALSWEVLLSPGIDRHAQKISNDVLELQEIKRDKKGYLICEADLIGHKSDILLPHK
ncbi:uncharacterized protein LOC134222420 [Armigeres subalbatus]|uniref:uncharacterized protein LOC134222420 n=1 Tax=Armigeres subalbatus TaxID=124917 RepID=UPI002ED28FAA